MNERYIAASRRIREERVLCEGEDCGKPATHILNGQAVCERFVWRNNPAILPIA